MEARLSQEPAITCHHEYQDVRKNACCAPRFLHSKASRLGEAEQVSMVDALHSVRMDVSCAVVLRRRL